jgi:hypothetical protein
MKPQAVSIRHIMEPDSDGAIWQAACVDMLYADGRITHNVIENIGLFYRLIRKLTEMHADLVVWQGW